MRRVAVGLLLLISLPSSALAQATSCGMELGRWVCRPEQGGVDFRQLQTPNFMESYAAGRAAGERNRANANAAAANRRAEQDADQAAIVRGRVAGMVRDGDCEGAKNLALTAGNMDLAQQAVSLCAPRAREQR